MGGEIRNLFVLLEDGFVDLALNLEALIRNDDGSHYFEARAEYKGKPVAFAVVLSPTGNGRISKTLRYRFIGVGRDSSRLMP